MRKAVCPRRANREPRTFRLRPVRGACQGSGSPAGFCEFGDYPPLSCTSFPSSVCFGARTFPATACVVLERLAFDVVRSGPGDSCDRPVPAWSAPRRCNPAPRADRRDPGRRRATAILFGFVAAHQSAPSGQNAIDSIEEENSEDSTSAPSLLSVARSSRVWRSQIVNLAALAGRGQAMTLTSGPQNENRFRWARP